LHCTSVADTKAVISTIAVFEGLFVSRTAIYFPTCETLNTADEEKNRDGLAEFVTPVVASKTVAPAQLTPDTCTNGN
jgi:hypothetical protein